MVTPRDPWRVLIETYPCPSCYAEPREACTTYAGGNTTTPHIARIRQIDRCPTCLARMPAGTEPGDVCERCLVVRALEVERMTHHRRLDP